MLVNKMLLVIHCIFMVLALSVCAVLAIWYKLDAQCTSYVRYGFCLVRSLVPSFKGADLGFVESHLYYVRAHNAQIFGSRAHLYMRLVLDFEPLEIEGCG